VKLATLGKLLQGPGAAELPPNIKEFNEITAVILAECYKSHPKATAVHVGRIAQMLGVSASDVMPQAGRFRTSACIPFLG
jgi:hypothetical protein